MSESAVKTKDQLPRIALSDSPNKEPLVQPIIRAEHMQPRMQKIFALLLQHESVICGGNIGMIEFHFHRNGEEEGVKAKLVHNLG